MTTYISPLPDTTLHEAPAKTVDLRTTLADLFSLPVLLGFLLALCVYLLSAHSVADEDVWWHLRSAEHLLTTGHYPSVDTYSFTVAGDRWISHEWLAEIPYYLAWKLGGLKGLYILYLSLAEATLLGLFYLAFKTSGNFKSAFVASCMGVLLCAVSFGPRTLLFGWLYLVVLCIVLCRYRKLGRGPLWVIPPLFCLWVNSHGSWLIGIIVFATVIASGVVKWRWHRIDAIDRFEWLPQQLRSLTITAACSVAALFVNPFGYRLVFYPFDLAFRQKLNAQHISEWTSVDFHTGRGKVVIVMLAALFLLALFRKRKWRLDEIALALFALYAGLTYVRFLFLTAILLAPLLSKELTFLPPYRKERDKPWLNAIGCVAIAMFMVVRFPSEAKLQSNLEESFPVAAVSYMQTQHLHDRVMAYYSWGGYLTWQNPPIPTFIDGRADIFEYRGVFKDYLDAIELKAPLEVMNKYRIQYVLFPSKDPVSYLLRRSPEWKMEYSDDVSAVFRRVDVQRSGLKPTSAADEAGR